MNSSVESVIRFVNLTASGLLAGSLGFGEAALVPGWESERPRKADYHDPEKTSAYFNAIGPVALATSMTLAIGSNDSTATRRSCDILSAVGLAGVLAATMFVTVPINRKLETAAPPADYPSQNSHSLTRNWARAHALRTALGIGAFALAVAANVNASRRK